MSYPPLKFMFEGGPKDGQEFKLPKDPPKVAGGLWLDPKALIERKIFIANGYHIVDDKKVAYTAQYTFSFDGENYRAVYIEPKQKGESDV